MKIRLGKNTDIDALEQLYNTLTAYLESTTNYPGWKRGVYPARQDAAEGIRDGCLFVATEHDEIIGSMILRSKSEPAYLSAPWQAALDDSSVLILHTFAVSPHHLHQGIGKQLLTFAEQYAKESDIKALRLDVYEKNAPAIRLYEKSGYQYIDTVSLGLEEFGLNGFKLYEKLL